PSGINQVGDSSFNCSGNNSGYLVLPQNRLFSSKRRWTSCPDNRPRLWYVGSVFTHIKKYQIRENQKDTKGTVWSSLMRFLLISLSLSVALLCGLPIFCNNKTVFTVAAMSNQQNEKELFYEALKMIGKKQYEQGRILIRSINNFNNSLLFPLAKLIV